MNALPRKAQLFLILTVLAGIGAGVAAVFYPFPRSSVPAWEFAAFLILATVAGGKKVVITRIAGADEDDGSMSVGFLITFLAMMHLGPADGICVAAMVSVTNGIYPKVQKFHQLIFNVSLACVEAAVAGGIFVALNGHQLTINPVDSFPAIAASCLAYYAINTGGVATIIALCTEENVVTLWRETFLWTAPGYFAGAAIGAAALVLFGTHIGGAILFGSPVAYLMYQSYATYVARRQEAIKHSEEIEISKAHLADLYLSTIKSLALAIDAKDQYTHQHILRVQRYSVAIAKQMGLTGNDLEGVNTGALLHDIGKLGVPEYVLLKPGRLTDAEFDKIKKHPEIGAAILEPVEFPWPVLPVVRHHHEKWDGTGYPDRLAGEDIPLTARIMAVADVYDALTSNRSYRNAWTHERACEVITKDAGTHFDPVVVDAFLVVIGNVVEEMRAEKALIASAATDPVAKPSKADQAVRDIQRASSELWALYEVAQTLSTSLGLQDSLDILVKKLEAIMPGTTCVFMLTGDVPDTLVARSVVGPNLAYFTGSRTVSPRSLSLDVMRKREGYLGEYDSDDILLTGSNIQEWTALKSALIVPIVFEDSVLGTINVYHGEENVFTRNDRQLLETIAERAAMAIFNGLSFDRSRREAPHDPLTGLVNISRITDVVEREVHKRSDLNEPFALLCVDLDSFKPVNDNFGYQRGDVVLRELAEVFRTVVSDKDIVSRFGGDEFLIYLADADRAKAETVAQRIHAAVQRYDPKLVHERLGALRVDVSVGSACYPADGADYNTLLSAADTAMNRVKSERKLSQLAKHAEPIEMTRIAA